MNMNSTPLSTTAFKRKPVTVALFVVMTTIKYSILAIIHTECMFMGSVVKRKPTMC